VLLFRPALESSSVVAERAAMPYDSGGATKYAAMSHRESKAAKQELALGRDYRSYLARFLHCAFDDPLEYLEDAPGPDLKLDVPKNKAAAGLAKALSQRDDPCCWTVELKLRPRDKEVALAHSASRGHLVEVLVVGSDHEPELAKLEHLLGEEHVAWEGEPVHREDVQGLAESLRLSDQQRYTAAQRWSVKRIRAELEDA
jgi:hypothetical protein